MGMLHKLRRRLGRRVPREYAIRYRLLRASLSPRAIMAERRADVLLISYPKCGRTWLRMMISRALELHTGARESDPLATDVMRGADDPGLPRIRVSHDGSPHWKTPRAVRRSKRRYRSKKVLFLVRDPRDVVVSMYFERSRRERAYSKPLADFLHESRGSLDTIIEYYNVWYRARRVPRDFAIVRYEDMQADAVKELRRVLDFLGLPDVSDTHVRQAVEFGSFENMRALEETGAVRSGRLRPRDAGDVESFKTRRGKVGGYVDYLDAEQVAWIEERIARKLDPFFGYC
jgi:hypothetical protein